MIVRPAREADFPAWAAMRARLWPDEDPAELESELDSAQSPPLAMVAEEAGRLIGFAEASVRSVAEGGPAGPAAYLEGIWVDPEHRRRGVGRAMLEAVESWALGQGFAWLGSEPCSTTRPSPLARRRGLRGGRAARRLRQGAPLGVDGGGDIVGDKLAKQQCLSFADTLGDVGAPAHVGPGEMGIDHQSIDIGALRGRMVAVRNQWDGGSAVSMRLKAPPTLISPAPVCSARAR